MRYELSDVRRLITADEFGWVEPINTDSASFFGVLGLHKKQSTLAREIDTARNVLSFAVRSDGILKDSAKGYGAKTQEIEQVAGDCGLKLELLPDGTNKSGTLCRLSFGNGLLYRAYLWQHVGKDGKPFLGRFALGLYSSDSVSVDFDLPGIEASGDFITLSIHGAISESEGAQGWEIDAACYEILRSLVDTLATANIGLVEHRVINGRLQTESGCTLTALWVAAFTNDGFAFHRECQWCGKPFATNKSNSRCCCPEHSARLRTYNSNGRGRKLFIRSGSNFAKGGER